MIKELVGDYAFYYVEANAFCVLILLILYFKTAHSVDRQRRQVFFGETLATAMVYLTTDMFWVLVDSGKIPNTPFLLYLTNIIYYWASATMSYVVSYFMLLYEGNKKIEEPMTHFLTALPCLLNIGVLVTTPIHKMYIYVDGNGQMVNGPLYPVLFFLIIAYPVTVAIRAVYMFMVKENYVKRNMYKAIIFFPVLPVGLGIVQVFNTRIPFLCFGLTIALLLTYIEFTDDLVSLDPLTKINNRNELYRYLTGKMAGVKTASPLGLYLLIMDIDSFKKINDTYGHNGGDHALKLLSKVLKRICASQPKRFVARYGGDEFIVVAEASDDYEVLNISDEIHSTLKKAITVEQLPFNIDVSIGWAKYTKNISNINELIEKADIMLYEEKKTKHKVRKTLEKVG